MTNKIRITFKLERDEEGYPPNDYETLWAEPLEGQLFRIDNAPFFVKGISSDDIVSVVSDGNVTYFDKLIRPSENSTVRIVFYNKFEKDNIVSHLKYIGCYTEQSHIDSLVSVEIPNNISFNEVMDYIKMWYDKDVLDYEESAIRQ
nr:DUF4265 domain-containing protein [Asticcacaulis taihuensis]